MGRQRETEPGREKRADIAVKSNSALGFLASQLSRKPTLSWILCRGWGTCGLFLVCAVVMSKTAGSCGVLSMTLEYEDFSLAEKMPLLGWPCCAVIMGLNIKIAALQFDHYPNEPFAFYISYKSIGVSRIKPIFSGVAFHPITASTGSQALGVGHRMKCSLGKRLGASGDVKGSQFQETCAGCVWEVLCCRPGFGWIVHLP